MRAVIQRVLNANVEIDGQEHASIQNGLLIFLAVAKDDTIEDIDWLAQKIIKLRIFNDEADKMNLSILDLEYEILVISQFTLFALTAKGNRPSFIESASPDFAIPLYDLFIQKLKIISNLKIKSGEFGADMKVGIKNDGPVTILIDTKRKE